MPNDNKPKTALGILLNGHGALDQPVVRPLTADETRDQVQAIVVEAFHKVKQLLPDHAPFVMLCHDDPKATVVLTPLDPAEVLSRLALTLPPEMVEAAIPAAHDKAVLVAAVRHAFKYIPETTGATARRLLTEALSK